MSQDLNLYSFRQSIHAPVEQIYRCFTSNIGFQEWLCHSAHVSPRPGGYLMLAWNSGFYTLGEYVRLEPCREIQFSWHGRGEPQSTHVQVLLTEQKNGSQVELIHSCIGNEEIWVEAKKSIQTGWEKSLTNLESVLTNGIDQRIVNRPAIGIYPIEMNSELAVISGITVNTGIYLNDVIEGRSASQAGLLKGDVIVEIDGEAVNNVASLVRSLQSHRIGDRLEVGYYRGKSRLTSALEILPLQIPEIPLERSRLASDLRQSYEQDYSEVVNCFRGISDDVASQKIRGGWSANEVLAHLIHTEKDLHFSIQSAIFDQDYQWTDNSSARIEATLAAYPTHKDLLEELQKAQAETIAFLERLPDEFTSRKSSFWSLGYGIFSMKSHTQEHISQIRQAIKIAQD